MVCNSLAETDKMKRKTCKRRWFCDR